MAKKNNQIAPISIWKSLMFCAKHGVGHGKLGTPMSKTGAQFTTVALKTRRNSFILQKNNRASVTTHQKQMRLN